MERIKEPEPVDILEEIIPERSERFSFKAALQLNSFRENVPVDMHFKKAPFISTTLIQLFSFPITAPLQKFIQHN